jgi:translation initiation factor IF-2
VATIRIYKVAEVLGIPSQEVIDLLKREHGIEAKSASSTIEEIVARQFAERTARDRNLSLPTGPLFSAKSRSVSRGRKGAKTPEPAPRPRLLGAPRLIKAPKVASPVAIEEAEEAANETESPPAAETTPNVPVPADPVEAPPPAAAKVVTSTGRIVPSMLTLRVEDKPPPSPLPAASAKLPATPAAARLAATPPGARPPTRPRPGSRPIGAAPTRPSTPPGGARPLPAQPFRPLGRPAVGYRPSFRPPPRRFGARKRRPARPMMPQSQAPPPAITRTISLAEGMTVKDLAEKLELRAKDVLKKLIERRMMLTINTTLDNETATMVAREFGADIEMRSYEEEMVAVESASAQDGNLVQRAPIVTVMGHVDHGKTTLLDAIRKARVAERESGGITQHIGAYTVEINDRRIVFLDTPGHEAFTLMRARGARVTDVVILVVAADDGVMPQTKEAIEHARAAKVPLVVAINKIDKANANPERVKTELSELGLTPEKWGGQTVTVEVSAKEQQNLDSLLEMLLLVTEMGELKANPARSASGTVLEAKMDRGRGPVATVLVSDGTVRIGDNFIAGPIVGKVRALIDDRGDPQKEAGPSSPIEILGLTGLPQPGDGFQVVMDAAKARQIAMIRQNQARAKTLGTKGSRLTLESLQQQIAEGGTKELPIIVKADVQGSAEVLADALGKLGDDRVKVRLISSGAGAITEGDVVFAAASNAIIIGFNVRPDRNAAAMALREQIDIRLHRVIYDITDEVKKAMAGLLDPTVKEVKIGAAVVREVFKVPKFGAAAGSMVQEGKITRTGDTQARLLRDNVVIHEGRLGSLRRFKDDATEVKHGLECGIAFERYADIKVGDVIEVFTIEHIAATV